jgi:hypothetical protein
MATAQDKDEAFAAALSELYKRYPPVTDERDKLRERVHYLASKGYYRNSISLPHGIIAVPPATTEAIHTLIYG